MNRYKIIRDIPVQDIEPENKEDGLRLAKRVLMFGIGTFIATIILGLIICYITG